MSVAAATTIVSASPHAAIGVRTGAIPRAAGRTTPDRAEHLDRADRLDLPIAEVLDVGGLLLQRLTGLGQLHDAGGEEYGCEKACAIQMIVFT